MIRVVLPAHLRSLAGVSGDVELEVEGHVSQRSVLNALEFRYPMLRGTLRDHVTQMRRPFVRFFACEQDLSHELPDAPLPPEVASGEEPFLIVGAIAGGKGSEPVSKTKLWAGRILYVLTVFLLLLDAVMKIVRQHDSVVGTVQLGYPDSTVAPIGIALLCCTILYAIPRTAVFGAVLVTAYLGGAVASHVRAGAPLFGYPLAPVFLAVLVWGGLYLRDERVRNCIR
jgi:hypothetical protein